MLGIEGSLQVRLDEAGVLATAEGLRRRESDCSPISVTYP
jgi:hypothetical protein